MIKRIRQYIYIVKIRKTMRETSLLRFLHLNGYKSSAAKDLLFGKIHSDFYKNIFLGGNMSNHYTEVNKEKIENYTFWG